MIINKKLKRILNKLTLRNSIQTKRLLKEQATKLNNEKRLELAEKDRQIKQLNAAQKKAIRIIEREYNLKHLELDRRILLVANKDSELTDKHHKLDQIIADSQIYLSDLKNEKYKENMKEAKLKDFENRRDFIYAQIAKQRKNMRN
jgi:hypothetical protein